jgi:alpha-tubulin suppressor-like RCC1 family protein
VQVTANFERVPLLAVGGAHACALRADGVLRCWGYNASGQLGLGHRENIGDDEVPSSQPPVDIPPGIKGLCAGALHSCALLDGGQVRCWGHNFNGQLGLNHNQNIGDDPTETSIFTNAAINAPARQITCHGSHTCALLVDGDVRCWGRGDYGQLGYGCAANVGDGTMTCASLNDSVPLGTSAVHVDAGSFHTCATLSTGAIRCWGNNEYGQLGYGHMENLGDDPSEVGDDISIQGGVARVLAGGHHTCALMSDGSVRCWGRGDFGQLGNNSMAMLTSPASTGVLLGSAIVRQLSSEDHHNCAVLTTGVARCWGRSSDGQIGYGTLENLGDDPQDMIVNLPLQDMDMAIAGGSHSCSLSRGGEVTCWGRANEGQLGYGNMVQIGHQAGSLAGSGGPVSF